MFEGEVELGHNERNLQERIDFTYNGATAFLCRYTE